MKKTILASIVIAVVVSGSISKAQVPRVIRGGVVRGGIPRGHLLPHDPPQNANSVFAPGVRLDLPLYSGNGCPQGTVAATLSPDQKTLSVLFDRFQIGAGPSTNNTLDRKLCRIRIPVTVPRGFQVSIVKTDFRGFNSLPGGAETRVKTTHHLSLDRPGSSQMIDRQPFVEETVFQGPLDEEFFVGNHIEEEQVWSPCSRSFSLNVGASVQVMNNGGVADALSTIDSLDVQTGEKGVEYHLNWRRCQP